MITSGFTYFLTIEAIYNVGAVPYIVDIDLNTLQIDFKSIDEEF